MNVKSFAPKELLTVFNLLFRDFYDVQIFNKSSNCYHGKPIFHIFSIFCEDKDSFSQLSNLVGKESFSNVVKAINSNFEPFAIYPPISSTDFFTEGAYYTVFRIPFFYVLADNNQSLKSKHLVISSFPIFSRFYALDSVIIKESKDFLSSTPLLGRLVMSEDGFKTVNF